MLWAVLLQLTEDNEDGYLNTLTAKLREEQLRDEKIEFPSKPISRLPRPEPSLKVYPRSQSTEEVIVPGQDVPSRRVRRGRGARQVVGVNGSDDPNDPVC